MPLGLAIFLLIIGLLLGSVFTFGMQHWNRKVAKQDCELVETGFVSYEEIGKPARPSAIQKIAVDCTNGNRYFIDGVSVNQKLRDDLSKLSAQENIVLLIHPNSNTIVELSHGDDDLLTFVDTIHKLRDEATGFLFLGIFMYLCSFVGLYYTVLQLTLKKKAKRGRVLHKPQKR